ncbi:MAG: alpha/beta fold hydrolase [Alphaproteobacteria bacterium]|nr:MAG: alpha/beta fold hydrolase [Alphaproteobacteria bacterium]
MHGLRFIFVILAMALQPVAYAQLRVEVGASEAILGGGRLLVFVRSINQDEGLPEAVDGSAFEPDGVVIAAREVSGFAPGQVVGLDGDDLSFPATLAELASGTYAVQAVLDHDHSYAYSGRGPGDVLSEVAMIRLESKPAKISLRLQRIVPAYSQWQTPWAPAPTGKELAALTNVATHFEVDSPALKGFHGRQVSIRGIVVRPLDYGTTADLLPVVYFTHGFGGGLPTLNDTAMGLVRQMKSGNMPRLIWILLDQSGPMGTHEFADSLNNGPWGTALTTELIPYIESNYRADARVGARFLLGHSSGGWAALWAQLSYPSVFGGAWATSPDYSDFTDFGGTDLTAPSAVVKSTSLARMEQVLGEYGGQTTSFEAVWSPRGGDGRPMPLFDRNSGVVDPVVAQWWRAHWDLTEKVRKEWNSNRAMLDGKLHVIVGTQDQFDLDDSARRLQAAVKLVNGDAEFTYVPGKGHFDLYVKGTDRAGLRRSMAWEMWREAKGISRTE